MIGISPQAPMGHPWPGPAAILPLVARGLIPTLGLSNVIPNRMRVLPAVSVV